MVNTTDILPNTPRYLKVPLIVFNVILWVCDTQRLLACNDVVEAKLKLSYVVRNRGRSYFFLHPTYTFFLIYISLRYWELFL